MNPSVITWISAVVSAGICTIIPPIMYQSDEDMRLEEVEKSQSRLFSAVCSKARLYIDTSSIIPGEETVIFQKKAKRLNEKPRQSF